MTDTRVQRFGPTRRGRRLSAPAASLAVAALALGVLAGCGDDTGDADTASDTPAAATTSATTSPSASPSASASASATPTEAPVPDLDPVIVKAVQGALDEGFPALIPTVVPDGWTVAGAEFKADSWNLALTDTTGTPVVLTQRKVALPALVSALVGQDAQKSGSVDLSGAGLSTWGVYEAEAAVGIGTKLPTTSVVVTATDAATAQALAKTLIAAEDSDMPEAG